MRELENGCDVPPLSAKERDIHEAGLVSVLKEIHDDIDRATFEAYGWADLIPALVGKPGATAPSPHKTPEQEEAEEELLARLVALNRERAEEERRGIVRWLRPDYQIPKLGHKVKVPGRWRAGGSRPGSAGGRRRQAGMAEGWLGPHPRASRHAGPGRRPCQRGDAERGFQGPGFARRRKSVEKVLETLAAAGAAQRTVDGPDGDSRYFIPR